MIKRFCIGKERDGRKESEKAKVFLWKERAEIRESKSYSGDTTGNAKEKM